MSYTPPDLGSEDSTCPRRLPQSFPSPGSFLSAKLDIRPRNNVHGYAIKDEGDVGTLPELIEFNAKYNSDHLFCLQTLAGFDESNDLLHNFLHITHGSFYRSVLVCQQWLRSNIPGLELPSPSLSGGFVKGPPVALFMESEIGLLMYLSALARLGVPALLLSARLSPTAIEKLLKTTGTRWILTTPRLEQKAKEATSLFANVGEKPSIHFREDFEKFHGPSGTGSLPLDAKVGSICQPGYCISEEDRNVVILHSSGTTGLPKPIYTAHRYLLGYAACHSLTEDVLSSVNMSTLPLYHGFGMLAPALSMSIGLTVCLPPSSIIPTAASTLKIMKLSGANSIMTVPSILEDIARISEPSVFDRLRQLQFVLWGGGRLKDPVREELAMQGLKLVNHSGATEVGALGSVFVPDGLYDSRYVRFRQDLGLVINKAVTEQGHPQQYTMTAYPFGWAAPFVLQDKLVTNPNHPGADFDILGRNDDLLVLATGEKVLPQILETMLEAHPNVKAALAFGESQFEIGVIVEPLEPLDDDQKLRLQLWPIIQEAGSKMDSHARLSSPEAILFVAPGALPRSDKGSLMRKEAYRLLDGEIKGLYRHIEDHPPTDVMINIESPAFSEDLKQYILKALSWEGDPDRLKHDADLFEFGMDSLQAIRLRRALLPTLLQDCQAQRRSDIAKDFLYQYPSVSAIAKFIKKPQDNPFSNDQRQRDINQVVHDQVEKANDMSQPTSILLTGSTGSLGCHLVRHLCEQDQVTSVICLIRKQAPTKGTGKMPLERQLEALAEKGLQISSQGRAKLQVIETNTAEPQLGLSASTYCNLVATVTHILHNGWPVDFLWQFRSFQSQFDTLGEFIRLARRIHAQRSWMRPTVQFVSSISTIGRFGEKHNCVLVPETAVFDASCTNGIGYAAAKLACENILEQIAESHSKEIEARYVRVGQMSGARSSGYWKSSEHFPALIKSSQLVDALPSIRGTLSWLPVDDAAACMSQILFAKSGRGCVYHLENPLRQSWDDVLHCLAGELQIKKLVSMNDWRCLVANQPDEGNPAKRLLLFFEHEFEHNASGHVVMDTFHSRQLSPSLACMQPVGTATIREYVHQWKQNGFLP